MYNIVCDVAVIGGGPAGLAAAVAAKKRGEGNVLIIERDISLGGILQQCIHPGFGLSYYGEELTGPEYAYRFVKEAKELGVSTLLDTMVLEICPGAQVVCSSAMHGIVNVQAKSVVLAMGCRERTRGAIQIPGTRPAGVYTAGAAQRLVNRQNALVGKKILILGSGDIGMIMARRMTLEGAKVVAVVEIMDYLAGLTRNRVQCLDDFGIPLLLSHTVTRIVGNERVEGVYVSQVDQNRLPKLETETLFECDTLLLSVGLIPENELSRAFEVKMDPVTGGPVVNQHMQTSVPWMFACGNVVHVNDLVDNVSLESERAGTSAAAFAMGSLPNPSGEIRCVPGANIRYISPQHITLPLDEGQKIPLFFRVSSPDKNSKISASNNGNALLSRKVFRVNPGEMEHVEINADKLSAGDLNINVLREEVV